VSMDDEGARYHRHLSESSVSLGLIMAGWSVIVPKIDLMMRKVHIRAEGVTCWTHIITSGADMNRRPRNSSYESTVIVAILCVNE
jgi:hypothetical protein